MKILLVAVNAKFIHTSLAIRELRAFARSVLTAESAALPEIEIAEYTINQPPREVLSDIWNRRADVAAFSCYIWNIAYIETLLGNLSRICPGMPLWAGGPEVSYDAPDFLRRHPEVTGVMTGEGENSFASLAGFYGTCSRESGLSSLSEIPGIVFRDGSGHILSTGHAIPVEMDKLPFVYSQPDFDKSQFRHQILYYESSRGCPFRCSYCLSSLSKTVRYRSLSLVLPELQFFLDSCVPQVKFTDRTFNCSHSRTKEILRYLALHDNGITNFHFEIAADLLDDEEICLLSSLRPGQVQLEIGVQSANPATLSAICRETDLGRLGTVMSEIGKSRNVHRHLDLIAGLPYEDYASFRNSFNITYAMEPEQLQLGFLKVLKGSGMQEKAQEYGLVSEASAPYEVLQTQWLPFADLQKLKDVEEMLEIYGNSGQFRHAVRWLCEQFPTPFDMFESLALWHRRMGYFRKSLSRLDRFSALRDFCLKVISPAEADTRIMDELLLLDLYLRENSKSRPLWAPDPSEGKEVFRIFYKREADTSPGSTAAPESRQLTDYDGYDAKQLAHMTHAEVFRTDVLHCGLPLPLYVVFDYRHRDPVTGDAKLILAG